MIKCIIFDMDGTIADTLPLCITSFRNSIEKLANKVLSDEAIIDTFGPSEEGTIMALIPDYFEDGVKEYRHQYALLHRRMVPKPFPGIWEAFWLIKERNIGLALVTGKGRGSLDISLREFNMEDCFDEIGTGIPSGPSKPQCIRSVMENMNLRPEEVIYIGDTKSDVIAAKSVGVTCFSAAWDKSVDMTALKKCNSERIFYTVDQLIEYIKNLSYIGKQDEDEK
jgi:phosphoglycolate phosphatase/pyrophosphatase PpaX